MAAGSRALNVNAGFQTDPEVEGRLYGSAIRYVTEKQVRSILKSIIRRKTWGRKLS